jgi:hypothetical protein
MPIRIRKVSKGLYVASATPPDVHQEWSSVTPLDRDSLIENLLSRGAHQTDVGDAFYEADPEWLVNK